MRLFRIAFALTFLVFVSSVFASKCPTADQVRNCHGDDCTFQRIAGWSEQVFYTDQGKPFSFQREKVESTEHGTQISCYYSYVSPKTNRSMPPALKLTTIVN